MWRISHVCSIYTRCSPSFTPNHSHHCPKQSHLRGAVQLCDQVNTPTTSQNCCISLTRPIHQSAPPPRCRCSLTGGSVVSSWRVASCSWSRRNHTFRLLSRWFSTTHDLRSIVLIQVLRSRNCWALSNDLPFIHIVPTLSLITVPQALQLYLLI